MHFHPHEHATTIPQEYNDAITATRKDLTRLGACWSEFTKHASARLVAFAIAVTLVVRLAVGNWSFRDALIPFIILAAQPFVEWVIHRYLLHLKPFTIRGKQHDLYTARAHRRHHKAPAALDRVLLHASEISVSMFLIAITTGPIIAGAVALIFGGAFWPVFLTTLLFAYLGLFRYEWSHFLIHTPYIPKTKASNRSGGPTGCTTSSTRIIGWESRQTSATRSSGHSLSRGKSQNHPLRAILVWRRRATTRASRAVRALPMGKIQAILR